MHLNIYDFEREIVLPFQFFGVILFFPFWKLCSTQKWKHLFHVKVTSMLFLFLLFSLFFYW